jgi:hypothetical protein
MVSFDLRDVEEGRFARVHSVDARLNLLLGSLFAVWIVGVVIVLLGLAPFLPTLRRGGETATLWLLAFALFVVFGLSIGSLWSLTFRAYRRGRGRGPVRLDIDDAGFTFVWATGAKYTQTWSRVRSFWIKDYTGCGYWAWTGPPRRLTAALSSEAVQGLATAAQRQGLEIWAAPIARGPGIEGTMTTISRHPSRFASDRAANRD